MKKQKIVVAVAVKATEETTRVMEMEVEFSSIPINGKFRINNGCQCSFLKVSDSTGKVIEPPKNKPEFLNIVKCIPSNTKVVPL